MEQEQDRPVGIGPRQVGSYGMVVPRFVEAALKAEPLPVYGTGEQTRSFVDVADTVLQVRDRVDPKYVLGRGRLEQIVIRALQVDANAAYTLVDAAHLRRLDAFDLLLIEQPLAEHDLRQHSELARVMATPMCLDESVVSAASAAASRAVP